MNMKRYIANRFQHAGSGLSLDTEALAKYRNGGSAKLYLSKSASNLRITALISERFIASHSPF